MHWLILAILPHAINIHCLPSLCMCTISSAWVSTKTVECARRQKRDNNDGLVYSPLSSSLTPSTVTPTQRHPPHTPHELHSWWTHYHNHSLNSMLSHPQQNIIVQGTLAWSWNNMTLLECGHTSSSNTTTGANTQVLVVDWSANTYSCCLY